MDPLHLFFLLSLVICFVKGSPQLLLANRKDIRLIDAETRRPNSSSVLITHLEDAVALDFYYDQNMIFWTDIGTEVIQSLRLSNQEQKTIISTGLISPDGLSCDWLGKKLYWTDSENNRVEVANLNGSYRTVLYWEDMDQPRAIALVPTEGWMFWTDWGETAKIERAGMDGDHTTRKVIVNANIYWPNGLTVDYDAKRVYWADAKLKFISSMDYDGGNRAVVVSGNLSHPFALTLYKDMLYWTDWHTKHIHACNKKDGSQKRIVTGGNLSPMDIHSFMKDRQPSAKTPCDKNNGNCSHLCLMSPKKPYYVCACPTGVKLMADKKTCSSGAQEILLLARKTDIRRISLDTPDYTDVVLDLHEIRHSIAIDFDPVEKRIYWTDDEARVIRRAYLNGTGQENLVSTEVHNPDGIAVDWVARNLYWTDTGTDRIEVSRLNGTSRRILIAEGLDEPRAIVLDPQEGYMYWTDWGQQPKIERAALDGTDRNVLIDTDLGWPNGLAIDYASKKLYWGDAKEDRIESSDLDGSNRTVIHSEQLPHIFGFTVLGNYIYWTDWQRRSIERIHKITGQEHKIIIDQLPDLMGLKAVNVNKIYGTNDCAINNGGCSHLCLNRPKGKKVCTCPMGLELTSDLRTCIIPEAFLLFSRRADIRRISLESHHNDIVPLSGLEEASALDYDINDNRIYWTDTKKKTICRAFMNGSNIETVVEFGLDFPEGMAVDWVAHNLYWADMGTNRIEVARLDGSSRLVLFWKDLDDPRSLAIDPNEGYLYWSLWGKQKRIERAAMDGSSRSTLINLGGRANGLTIDYLDRRIYWVDISNNLIESADLHGTQRTQVLPHALPNPHSLTQYLDYIYWADWSTKSIERAHKIGGSNQTKIQEQVDSVIDILVFHTSRQSGWNQCAVNNGGCSHLCLAQPSSQPKINNFLCACPTHYQLALDNKTCQAPETFLLFSQRNAISRILVEPRDSPDIILPVAGLKNLKAIEYDPLERQIYWIDGRTHGIRRTNENGSKSNLLVWSSTETLHLHDLALDPFGRILYWTCAQSNTLNATQLDGRSLGLLVAGDGQRPRSLAVHPLKGYLFWTNLVTPATIERASLDGQQGRQTVISWGLDRPSSLAVDWEGDLLFWADLGTRKVEYSTLDGKNRTTLVSEKDLQVIALTVSGPYLYWLDKEQQQIERVSKFNGMGRITIQSRLSHLSDLLAVNNISEHQYHAHPCFIKNGGCSHLCLRVGGSSHRNCSCPTGLALAADNKTCINPPTCSPDQFTCLSGKVACIPKMWRCDGAHECDDESDEADCPACKSHEFRCQNGECIDQQDVCDGRVQCKDGSEVCCPVDEFFCPGKRKCIRITILCGTNTNCQESYDMKITSCSASVVVDPDPRSDIHNPNSNYTIGIIAAIVVLFLLFFIIYCYKRRGRTSDESEDVVDMMASKPLNSAQEYLMKESGRSKNTSIMSHRNPNGTCSMSVTLPRSSVYDRNHITGASSSSSGGTPYPQTVNPPPSPVTSSQYTYSQCSSHAFSVPRPSYRLQRLPHPTPCSTDVCDDSEPYPCRNRYYLSNTELSYDSDHYPPPPPTPHSHYLSEEGSYPPSPPPPSPVLLSDC